MKGCGSKWASAIRIEVNQPAPIAYGPVVLRYVQPPGHTYQPKLPGRTAWRLLKKSS